MRNVKVKHRRMRKIVRKRRAMVVIRVWREGERWRHKSATG